VKLIPSIAKFQFADLKQMLTNAYVLSFEAVYKQWYQKMSMNGRMKVDLVKNYTILSSFVYGQFSYTQPKN